MTAVVSTCPICLRDFYAMHAGHTYCGRSCQLEAARRAHYPEPETPEQYAARLAAAIERRPDLARMWGLG